MEKIAVATEDGTRLSMHFGRTPYFAVFSIEGGKVVDQELRPNTFTGHMRGQHAGGMGSGAGMAHHGGHSSVVDALADCRVIICGGAGARLKDALQEVGKELVITDCGLVRDTIEAYLRGEDLNTGDVCSGEHHGGNGNEH